MTRATAITLSAGPSQRIAASYQIPICRMLYPLRPRSCRQWNDESRSTKPPWWTTMSADRTSPTYPSAISSLIVRSTLSVMGAGTIWATRSGLSLDASSISWASAAFIAILASVRTCLPASSEAITIALCMYGQVPMQMASVSSASISSCQSS